MRHFTDPDFWKAYDGLPEDVQRLADKCFDRLKANPRHPSLHLKKIGEVWSARVGRDYRALAAEADDGLQWFWIGSHSEYDH